MLESRDHLDKKLDGMRELISNSTKDSEERVGSKVTLSIDKLESMITRSLDKEIRMEVRNEVQYAVGLMNTRKDGEAGK